MVVSSWRAYVYLSGHFAQNHDEQLGVFPVAIIAGTIDEEGRSAIHPAANAAAEIFTNLFFIRTSRQLAGHSLSIDSDSRRVHHEILILQRVLIVEEDVVHLPESSLGSSRLSSFGCPLGVRVRLA